MRSDGREAEPPAGAGADRHPPTPEAAARDARRRGTGPCTCSTTPSRPTPIGQARRTVALTAAVRLLTLALATAMAATAPSAFRFFRGFGHPAQERAVAVSVTPPSVHTSVTVAADDRRVHGGVRDSRDDAGTRDDRGCAPITDRPQDRDRPDARGCSEGHRQDGGKRNARRARARRWRQARDDPRRRGARRRWEAGRRWEARDTGKPETTGKSDNPGSGTPGSGEHREVENTGKSEENEKAHDPGSPRTPEARERTGARHRTSKRRADLQDDPNVLVAETVDGGMELVTIRSRRRPPAGCEPDAGAGSARRGKAPPPPCGESSRPRRRRGRVEPAAVLLRRG